MEQNEEQNYILNEKDFILTSDKKNVFQAKLFISNNELFCINLTTNNFPSKKYSISLTMNELIKNRFFKIFINLEEVFRELENKIEKSNIIEDTNLIYLDIPIGLNVINDIILEIKETEKSNDEIIKELTNELEKKNKLIIEKDTKINELENLLKNKSQIIPNENNKSFEFLNSKNENNDKTNKPFDSKNENEKKELIVREKARINIIKIKMKNIGMNIWEKDKIKLSLSDITKEKYNIDFVDLELKKKIKPDEIGIFIFEIPWEQIENTKTKIILQLKNLELDTYFGSEVKIYIYK